MSEYGAAILISDSRESSYPRTAFHTDLTTCMAWREARYAPTHKCITNT